MNHRLLPLIALFSFIAVPVVLSSAGPAKEESAKESSSETAKGADLKKDSEMKKESEVKKESEPRKVYSRECIASEEVVADIEAREKKIKEKEEALKEREKELAAQQSAVREELSKLESKKGEDRSVRQREAAAREEQVNRLMETFEGMSPKAAAQVIGGIDEDLAVMALGRLTSLKAGKILGILKPEKSARLSEMMAYGKAVRGKEGAKGDSHERAASSSEE